MFRDDTEARRERIHAVQKRLQELWGLEATQRLVEETAFRARLAGGEAAPALVSAAAMRDAQFWFSRASWFGILSSALVLLVGGLIIGIVPRPFALLVASDTLSRFLVETVFHLGALGGLALLRRVVSPGRWVVWVQFLFSLYAALSLVMALLSAYSWVHWVRTVPGHWWGALLLVVVLVLRLVLGVLLVRAAPGLWLLMSRPFVAVDAPAPVALRWGISTLWARVPHRAERAQEHERALQERASLVAVAGEPGPTEQRAELTALLAELGQLLAR